ASGARGVLFKAPKPGQDRRIDLPAIGPDTVAQAARAGLAGIAWQAGGVLLLDREATIAAARAAGLFLWARA
ncbi:MAG TPA: LpxI family protein, partial [Paracoccus sp.]|nr:LpxI family protein [Paracoccus sp. (in: a-proteobacteria)]